MKNLVVDASVAVKWFLPEVHSVAAVRLLESAFDLSAPDLIGPEVGNVLWKMIRRREISGDEASVILTAFGKTALEIYPSAPLLPAALELASAFDRTVYDSLYLALAIAQDRVLVTADRKFHSVVSESVFAKQIRWIEDAF